MYLFPPKIITDLDFRKCSDHELWKLITSGDRDGFQYLYETYFEALYFYGTFITQDEDKVKDTIQDLFVRIWTKRSQIDIQRSIKFYLFSAFRRNLYKQLKQDAKKVDCSVLDNVSLHPNFMDMWTLKEKNQSVSQYLKKHITELSPRHQEIIHLKFFEGLNYNEIGHITGLDHQYLYNIVNKVSKLLKEKIDRTKLSEL